MAKLAPMLAKLGYDPQANPPNYGQPDQFVLDNEDRIVKQNDKWEKNMKQVQEQKKNIDKLLEEEKQREKADGKDPSYNPPNKKPQRPHPNLPIREDYERQIQRKDPKRKPREYKDFQQKMEDNRLNPKFARRAEGPYPALR